MCVLPVILLQIEGQGFGSIYDCKFSPTGEQFVATILTATLVSLAWAPANPMTR